MLAGLVIVGGPQIFAGACHYTKQGRHQNNNKSIVGDIIDGPLHIELQSLKKRNVLIAGQIQKIRQNNTHKGHKKIDRGQDHLGVIVGFAVFS